MNEKKKNDTKLYPTVGEIEAMKNARVSSPGIMFGAKGVKSPFARKPEDPNGCPASSDFPPGGRFGPEKQVSVTGNTSALSLIARQTEILISELQSSYRLSKTMADHLCGPDPGEDDTKFPEPTDNPGFFWQHIDSLRYSNQLLSKTIHNLNRVLKEAVAEQPSSL